MGWIWQSSHEGSKKKAEERAAKLRAHMAENLAQQVEVQPAIDPDGGRHWVVWALMPKRKAGAR